MSAIIDSYDAATNALRKARAINDVIYRASEGNRQAGSIHDAADAAEDYLRELAESLKALYEAGSKQVES